jgi:hypothetical protein
VSVCLSHESSVPFVLHMAFSSLCCAGRVWQSAVEVLVQALQHSNKIMMYSSSVQGVVQWLCLHVGIHTCQEGCILGPFAA